MNTRTVAVADCNKQFNGCCAGKERVCFNMSNRRRVAQFASTQFFQPVGLRNIPMRHTNV